MKRLTLRERARIERAVANGQYKEGWIRGRFFLLLILIFLQFFLYACAVYSIVYGSAIGAAAQGVVVMVSIFAAFQVLNGDEPAFVKTGWILLLWLFPAISAPIYFLCGNGRATKGLKVRLLQTQETLARAEEDFFGKREPLTIDDAVSRYLWCCAGTAAYTDGEITYYADGAKLYKAMQAAVDSAEKFILLEYFIIKQGKLWTDFLKRLLERAACGVQVRILYDDFGCINSLPYRYAEYLESLHENVRCIPFNRVPPVLALRINNRDHRKMLVVDGRVAFTGGINLADEYIGEERRFGVWKDTGVRVEGSAVNAFTKSFFLLWNTLADTPERVEEYFFSCKGERKVRGIIQPFDDSPLDRRDVGEGVYAELLNRAEKYAYIFTPYLVLDEYLRGALCHAAMRGVDVRIVTPGIPDKKMVFRLTRANYARLWQAGVKIFEYKPGFIHAKSMLCDDKFAVVGTINFDYRSLYHHFENAVYFTDERAVQALKRDCEETFALSAPCTAEGIRRGIFGRVLDCFLRIFETLL